jgi:ABC-type multidrug transport system ATPase subunit
MTLLLLEAVESPPLSRFWLARDAGVHVLLGAAHDGTEELFSLLAGDKRPRSGRILLGNEPLHGRPDLRRQIGLVSATGDLPPARSVRDSVRMALSLRQSKAAEDAVLGPLGLGSLLDRTTKSLLRGERRAVTFALALSIDTPLLVVVVEPLVDMASLARMALRHALAGLATRGACVLCLTSSLRDASELATSVEVLTSGQLVRSLDQRAMIEPLPGLPVELVVRAREARRLIAPLLEDQRVTALRYDDQRGTGELVLSGADARTLSLSVSRAATELGVAVESLVTRAPSLELVQAATAGWARGAYDAAYSASVAEWHARATSLAVPPPLPGQWVVTTPPASNPPEQPSSPASGGGQVDPTPGPGSTEQR